MPWPNEPAPPAATFPALPAAPALPPDRYSAAVYLASLAEGPGRDGMRSALRHVAAMLGAAGIESCPWQALRYPHVAALRSLVAESTRREPA